MHFFCQKFEICAKKSVFVFNFFLNCDFCQPICSFKKKRGNKGNLMLPSIHSIKENKKIKKINDDANEKIRTYAQTFI